MSTSGTRAPSRRYGGVTAADRVAERHRRLLDAGLALFGTQGFATVRVTDVCDRAGLSTRYFYESFDGLADLFRAVHDAVIDTLYDAVAAAVAEDDGDPGAVLRRAIRAFVDTLAEDPRRWRVVFTEPAAVDARTRERSRTALRRFSDLVATTARTSLPASVPGTDVQLLALSVVGTLDHVIAEWLDGQVDLPLDRLVEACADRFEAGFRDLAAAHG